MKKYLMILLFVLTAITAVAQGNGQQQDRRQFDPAKFEAEMEQFIVAEAGLTQQESAKFLTLYREMRKKQMENFGRQQARKVDPTDEKACAEAIRLHDQNEIKMKVLQKTYHEKFLEVLPAPKVMRVIRAEEKFHRQAMRRVADRRQGKN